MAILKTSATRFARWLEQYTREMYLRVPLSQRRLWGFPPVRVPKEISETVVLGITAPPALVFDMASASLRITQMATLMGEVETVPPDAAIWFKIIPLAAERVEVKIGCKARGATDYFNKLLAAIAKRWPEAAEQLGVEAPTPTGDGAGKKHGPTVRTQIRAEVFRRLKDAHPEWSQARVAMEATDELGESVTEDAVRNAYRAMGWKWERGDRVR